MAEIDIDNIENTYLSQPGPNIPGSGAGPGNGRRVNSSLLEKLLARDPDFVGIGKATAAKLAKAFGDDLHAALSGRDSHVTKMLGIERAADLFTVYQSKLYEMDVAAWLSELEVDTRTAMKVIRIWGADGVTKLQSNPYLLIGFIGWKRVEAIARKLQIGRNDPRRAVAAVEHVLYSRLDEKHTLTKREDLERGVRRLLSHKANAQEAIALAVDALGAIPFADGYQPAGAAAMEKFIAHECLRLSEEEVQGDLIARKIEPDELATALDAYDASSPWPLTERQREAVAMAVQSCIGCLGGYAGSGKTTVLKAVCDVAEQFGQVVHLMALSGRAARRIAEATGRRAGTIASFLKHVADSGGKNLGPEAVIIIDEASMIDLPTLYRIMRHLGHARLLLAGDPAQLPPIGFGLTFQSLITDASIPNVTLDRVMRQSAETGIPAVADAIRNGQLPTLDSFSGLCDGVSFIECNETDVFDEISGIGRELGKQGMKRGGCQIIAPVKAGAGGINEINKGFHDLLTAGRASFPTRPDIAAGDPIIWTKNDWERNLQNGSMGRILSIDKDGIRAVMDEQGITLNASDGQFIDLAYAVSVHKAQGSQWDRIIVPIRQSRLLDRTLLYTAVTRAARQVIFVGDKVAFEMAVTMPPAVDQRETTLPLRMLMAADMPH